MRKKRYKFNHKIKELILENVSDNKANAYIGNVAIEINADKKISYKEANKVKSVTIKASRLKHSHRRHVVFKKVKILRKGDYSISVSEVLKVKVVYKALCESGFSDIQETYITHGKRYFSGHFSGNGEGANL